MHFVKFRKIKPFMLSVLAVLISVPAYAQLVPTQNGSVFQVKENPFPGVPSYGGTFTPGIGASIPAAGIPTVDLAKISEMVYKRITEQMQGEMIKEIGKTLLGTIGQAGQDAVDAINNGAANAVVRMNKAKEVTHNKEIIEQTAPSTTVCKDLAVSLSMSGDEACEMMDDIYGMYNGTSVEAGSASALMTIAKGLNHTFTSIEHENNKTLDRIVKRYKTGMDSSKKNNFYAADRFISQDVSTYDTDQVKDFKDFMYVLMPPVLESKEAEAGRDSKTPGGKSNDANFIRSKIDKGLTSTAFAATLMDRMPSSTGVSPLDAMRQYAITTYSEENLELLSKETTTTQLYRQMILMKAFEIHKKIKSYERSLESEQIAARKLYESLDPQYERL